MCLLAWNWQPDSDVPLLLIGNRDEFYVRPTRELHWWSNTLKGTDILAGRDMQAGGTWLGVSRSGRIAALTNFRSGKPQRLNAPSRGELVTGFLSGQLDAVEYLNQLLERASEYNPFNLLVFDEQHLLGLESRHARIIKFKPGIGAVSNAYFQTPWPKLSRLQAQLLRYTEHQVTDSQTLLNLLKDTTQASDEVLPDTGIAVSLEKALSSIFIRTSGYGTRCSSVIETRHHQITFSESRFDAQGPTGQSQVSFEH